MLEMKHTKQVELSDRVRFKCKRCGECCRHLAGALLVEPYDAYRIAKHLGMGLAEFYEKYTTMDKLPETLYPVFIMNTVGEKNSCIFLKGNRCSIQEVKPKTCRLYPFWVYPVGEDNGFFSYNLSYERSHHPKGTLIRVKDWMQKYFTEEDKTCMKQEFRAVNELAKLLRKIKTLNLKESVQVRVMFLISHYRYYAFELDKSFLEQQFHNDCQLIEELNKIIKSSE